MEAMLANVSVDISEFRRDPIKVLREAGQRPVAVINRNKPAFYLVEPGLFAVLFDHLEDIELAESAAKRMAKGERIVRVTLARSSMKSGSEKDVTPA
jgi:antitoxin StbD